MNRVVEFLSPTAKLVDEVVEWLCGSKRFAGKVRDVDGAKSLKHVMVIVPTAQSGRNLRLRLAQEALTRGWGGILSPLVVEPMALIIPADTSRRTANTIELRAAFLKYISEYPTPNPLPHLFHDDLKKDFHAQLTFFDQLEDIWRILSAGGIMMVDVPQNPRSAEVLSAALGDEEVRWHELATFETQFFALLHNLGLRHPVEDMKDAQVSAMPLPEGIEEVILPMLADPVKPLYAVLAKLPDSLKITVLLHCLPAEKEKFDEWGRPKEEAWIKDNHPTLPQLGNEDIIRTANDADLAKYVARDFPPAAEEFVRPTLGLCDNALYPELAAAFLNAGYLLHNPEKYRLANSSLGRILSLALDLYAAREELLPWASFVALLREDDILAVVADGDARPGRVATLAGLDVCQNSFLPRVLPKDLAFNLNTVPERERATFKGFLPAAHALLDLLEASWKNAPTPTFFLRKFLETLFATRVLVGGEGEKEFRAAIDVVRDTFNQFDADTLARLHLSEGAMIGLLRKVLAHTTYSLEPLAHHAIRTEGWLELIWSGADKIALVGLTEGAVPDSITGHPFVPDCLRAALGLTTNAQRLARDTVLFTDIVRSRENEPHSVRAYLAMTNAKGDQRRPSRLLFLVDAENLANRTEHLFGDLPASNMLPPRELEEAWRPKLPSEAPLPHTSPECPTGRLSASALDTWLKCPFNYLLQYGLEMQRTEEKDELGADDFGHLIHSVLEDYANEQLARTQKGLPQLTSELIIATTFKRLLKARRLQQGDRLSLKVRLQYDAIEGRLLAFVPLQAHWAQEGWVIAEPPEFRFLTRPFKDEGICDLPFSGNVDRIDYHPDYGYRIIDFKTWDKSQGALGRILKGGEKQMAHAAALGLPQVVKSNGKGLRFLSTQLLFYTHALECYHARFRGKIADCCYVILGKSPQDTVVLGSTFSHGSFNAFKRKCDQTPLLDYRAIALDTVRRAIQLIRSNIFWPPGPDKSWSYNFKELFWGSPEKTFPKGTPWRDEQEKRIAQFVNPGKEQA